MAFVQAESNIALAVISLAFLIVFCCCLYRLLITINYSPNNSSNGYYFLFHFDACFLISKVVIFVSLPNGRTKRIVCECESSVLITIKTKPQVSTVSAQLCVGKFPCLLQHHRLSASSVSNS